MPLVSCLPRSWNSGTSFFSDAVMQDSWWRLIVYFDVIGMVATRGAPFDSLFSSECAAAFSAVIQVRTVHCHLYHVQHQLWLQGLLELLAIFNDAWRVGCCQVTCCALMASHHDPPAPMLQSDPALTLLIVSRQHHPDTIKFHEHFPKNHQVQQPAALLSHSCCPTPHS
jgi:hypothetical protein